MNDSIDLKREDELMGMMEEMQDQIEAQEKKLEEVKLKSLEDKKMISKLSSVISEMKSELLKKSETIKSLNDRIGKLSTSDLVLKENELLKKQVKNLEQKLTSTRREVDDKLAEFNIKEQELNSRAVEIVDKEKHLTKKINEKVEARLSVKEGQLISVYKKYGNALERDYKNKEAKYMATFIMSLVYGIAVTTVQIIKSKVVQNDFIKTLMILADIGTYITNLLRKSIVNVWRLKISGNTRGDFAIDTLICIIIIGLIVALILTGINVIKTKIVPLIVTIADKWMLGIVLLILGCNLFLGKYVKALIPINLMMTIVFEIAISASVRIVINKVGITAIKELWNRVWPVVAGIVVLVLGIWFVGRVFY